MRFFQSPRRKEINYKKVLTGGNEIVYNCAPLLETAADVGGLERRKKKVKKRLTARADLDRVLACRRAPAGRKIWSLKTK